MTRRSMLAGALGAVGGAVAALLFMALMAPLVLETSAEAVLLDPETLRSRPHFVASAGASYLLVTLAGAAAGALIARIAVALAAAAHPEEPRLSAIPIALVGAGIGAAMAYAAFRTGVGAGGEIVLDGGSGEETLSFSVFRALVTALGGGAALGYVTAIAAEWLSRPAVLGLEGEAWPTSAARFAREAMTAMGIPILALLTLFAVAFGFSRLLLLEPGVFAVTIFSIGAAIVLGAAAFIAYLGGPPPNAPEE